MAFFSDMTIGNSRLRLRYDDWVQVRVGCSRSLISMLHRLVYVVLHVSAVWHVLCLHLKRRVFGALFAAFGSKNSRRNGTIRDSSHQVWLYS